MSPILTLFTSHGFHFLTSFLVLVLVTLDVVEARPCVAFDINFNLYAFGFGGKDFQLGPQSQWNSTVNPTDITSSGRPPFNGPQTTCYLAQFFNAIYVLNGDQSDPSAVHIFNVASKSWSTQAVSSGGPDPTSLVAILDHDTNVFYALANSTMSSLDLGEEVTANSTALTWNTVGNPSFTTTNYNPTMALAQNHIHFIGVPGSQPGTADIFVIHFSFFQPDAQSYPVQGGGTPFPSTHGQTASFFLAEGVQEEFAFIPDDSSATYVINVESNSTIPLAGPTDKSPSTFAASINALVQLTSTGSISFLPYTPGNAGASKAAAWSKINVQGLPTISPGNSSGNATSSGGGSSGTNTSTGPASSTTGNAGNSGKNGGLSLRIAAGATTLVGAVTAMALALL
ncbi:hypothetical protein K439DRAFT_1645192 [Ramaria rubella]|nr:hypothetical protein K439DRAFT_1645192 [Ramaria rubella]